MTRMSKIQTLFQNDDFVILTHKSPDGDTIGSASALCRALRFLGKNAYMHENPGITKRYIGLCHDLFAPEGFAAKFVIAVDIADEELFPENAGIFRGRVDLCIDHHISNTGYAKVSIIEDRATAAGEVIYKIIEETGVPFDIEIAKAIYTAISTDTGCFRYSNTTPTALRIAAKCYETGADIAQINRELFESKSIEKFHVEQYVIKNIEFYEGRRIAMVSIGCEVIEKIGATEDDLENISSILREPEGVLIGIYVREISKDICKISVRTNKGVSASEICTKFSGGGHERAAGCSIESPPELAKERILKAAREVLFSDV